MKIYRKIFMGVMTLILVATTFVTSTYAWFKMNSSANISGFDLTVTGGEGFLISIDDNNYSNDLSNIQMKKAILLGLDSQTFQINEKGNIEYSASNLELSDSQINEIIAKNIQLLPVTSQNGYEFTDMHGSKQTPASGRFVEFSLYFKTSSQSIQDERKYDLSLLVGSTVFDDEGKEIMPTTLKANVDNINLVADMNTINGNKLANDNISVYSANAMRFSIEEEKEIEFTPVTEGAEVDANGKTYDQILLETRNSSTNIYEFYNEFDLGSYPLKGSTVDIYNPDMSASFTYYNNQKASKIEALDELPTTIRYNQTTGTITKEEQQLTQMPVITRVESGMQSKKVTFRIWLEGWDADCFDGLAKSVKVNFTFASKKV